MMLYSNIPYSYQKTPTVAYVALSFGMGAYLISAFQNDLSSDAENVEIDNVAEDLYTQTNYLGPFDTCNTSYWHMHSMCPALISIVLVLLTLWSVFW